MNTSKLVALFALSITMFAMTGCAGETDEPTDEPSESTDVKVTVDTDNVGAKYTPKVTIEDIKDGFGSCVGTLCTINGKMWDCKGGGYCSVVQ